MRTTRRTILGLALTATTGACLAAFRDPLFTESPPTDRLTVAPMTAIASPGARRIVAAGWRGVVVASSDGGKTWKKAKVPVSVDLTALAFTSEQHGWAAGSDGVLLESTDGGLSWKKRLDGYDTAKLMLDKYQASAGSAPDDKALQGALKEAQFYSREAPARPFLDILFENEQVGYLVGAYGLIFRTIDAGRTWQPIPDRVDNPNGYHLYSAVLHRRDVYLSGELGLLLRLDRSQDRFVKVTTPYDGTFFTMVASERAIVAGGLRGNAFVSKDGGNSWLKSVFSGGDPGNFSGGTIVAQDGIVLATQSGQLFSSQDDGLTFKIMPVKSPMAYSEVISDGNGSLLTTGSRGIRIEALMYSNQVKSTKVE